VGREGFKEFMETWTEDFDWSVELERVVDIGEGRVVVESIQRALGRASGVPVELPVAAIWTLEGDQVVRIENYFDREEALAAARRPD
jgi:ketosteroid isomerase-like protein